MFVDLDNEQSDSHILISGVQTTAFSRVFVGEEKTRLKLVLYTPSNQDTTEQLAVLVYLRFTIYDLLDRFAILAAIITMRPVRLVA